MDDTPSPAETAHHIDLTRQSDIQYWCRVFDVTMDQLRDAVKHAGHTAEEVGRYLRVKNNPTAP